MEIKRSGSQPSTKGAVVRAAPKPMSPFDKAQPRNFSAFANKSVRPRIESAEGGRRAHPEHGTSRNGLCCWVTTRVGGLSPYRRHATSTLSSARELRPP